MTDNKLNEHIVTGAEYSSVKSEIISMINIQQTYIIAMYTITITILGIVLGDNDIDAVMFLLPYIILLPFQRIIDAKKYHYLKLSAYLAVYSDDAWERHYNDFEDAFAKQYDIKKGAMILTKIKKSRLVRTSSLHLGGLCTCLCLFRCWYELVVNRSERIYELYITAFFALILFLGAEIWTKNAQNAMKKREEYVQALLTIKNHEDNNGENDE